jgi:hypothetical protein
VNAHQPPPTEDEENQALFEEDDDPKTPKEPRKRLFDDPVSYNYPD